MQNGLYAKIATNRGDILIQLTFDKTPGTVGNFVALAEGKMENSRKPLGTPYYDGLNFSQSYCRLYDSRWLSDGDRYG
jgi:peptidyl-prolyl cis-trans isomerase A (cyclophilin A)